MLLTHLVQLQVKNNQTPSKASIHCPLCSGGRARTALRLSSSSHSPFLSPHTQEMAKATHHCNWGCVRRLSSCWKQYEFCCFSPPGFCCFPWQLSARMQQGTLYLQEPPPSPQALLHPSQSSLVLTYRSAARCFCSWSCLTCSTLPKRCLKDRIIYALRSFSRLLGAVASTHLYPAHL